MIQLNLGMYYLKSVVLQNIFSVNSVKLILCEGISHQWNGFQLLVKTFHWIIRTIAMK